MSLLPVNNLHEEIIVLACHVLIWFMEGGELYEAEMQQGTSAEQKVQAGQPSDNRASPDDEGDSGIQDRPVLGAFPKMRMTYKLTMPENEEMSEDLSQTKYRGVFSISS